MKAAIIFAFGILLGAILTFAIMPPKITHEVYLYRPKVKNSERVELLIQEIASDTVSEKRFFKNLFKRRRK